MAFIIGLALGYFICKKWDAWIVGKIKSIVAKIKGLFKRG